ncbi:unnamed protein product, partial [Ilex paraguariensis]
FQSNHGARKLRKAGKSRWLGRRPIVRGVAMNPVDHPHGGGSGELVPPSLAENEAAHPAQPLTTRERESASCSNSQARARLQRYYTNYHFWFRTWTQKFSQTGFGSTKSMRQKMQTKFFK